ncbi:MAG: hypothetical protein IJT82_03310 [Schwartzia sp.]|nr:hypothetical protein [Schwartzia sp. (in: firmicutes)]
MDNRKIEALGILSRCALEYDNELSNRNILFIYVDKRGQTNVFETTFLNSNYLHLTGIQTNIDSVNFYKKCLNRKLTADDIAFKEDGTTWRKLNILPRFVCKNISANMLGRFSATGMKLYTEKVVGQVNGTFGFILDPSRNIYVPNTILEEDIRKLSNDTHRIIYTFRKNIEDMKYDEIVYVAKKLNLNKIRISLPLQLDYLKYYIRDNSQQNAR